MRRAASASVRCLRQTTAVLGVLTAATTAPVIAQGTSSACKLLTVAELEAAIGGKATTQPSGSKQAAGAMTVDACSAVISGSGQTHPVTTQIVSGVSMDGATAIKTRNAGTAREQQWKVAGARLEQATIGSAICILTGRPSVASSTICSIPRGEGFVEVKVIGSVGELPSMEKVAALVQKAVSRL